jgi:hypothetical protein
MSFPTTPVDSPLNLEDIRSSALYTDLSTPKLAVGDRAFDFELPDGSRLFEAGRPVALVFGSYT